MKRLGEALASPRFFDRPMNHHRSTPGDRPDAPFPLSLPQPLRRQCSRPGRRTPVHGLRRHSPRKPRPNSPSKAACSPARHQGLPDGAAGHQRPSRPRRILADSIAAWTSNLATLHAGKLDDSCTRQSSPPSTRPGAKSAPSSPPPPAPAAPRPCTTAPTPWRRATQHLSDGASTANAPEASRRLVLPSRMRALSQRIAMHLPLPRQRPDDAQCTRNGADLRPQRVCRQPLSRSRKNGWPFPAETREAVAALSRLWPGLPRTPPARPMQHRGHAEERPRGHGHERAGSRRHREGRLARPARP
jgi:hypothetical protein